MLRVRKLLESDWEFLPTWWDKYDQEPWIHTETFRDIMPGAFLVGQYNTKRAGLGGFMVCKDNHPIAAMWLGLTNSHCALPTACLLYTSPSPRDS